MAETVPGRIHARAIFEKVKSFYVNFLLIILLVAFVNFLTILCILYNYGRPSCIFLCILPVASCVTAVTYRVTGRLCSPRGEVPQERDVGNERARRWVRPGELHPWQLEATPREGATSCILPGPPLDVQQLRIGCAWKILPIPCSCDSYNIQDFPLGFLFTKNS